MHFFGKFSAIEILIKITNTNYLIRFFKDKILSVFYLQFCQIRTEMNLLKIIKNKYFITIIGLVVWLIFFDKNDVFTQYDLIVKCNKLQKEKFYYLSEIENNISSLTELRNNKKSLETFSREKYLMKKENEDVFVFVSK